MNEGGQAAGSCPDVSQGTPEWIKTKSNMDDMGMTVTQV
jgi:hypothetical protein